MLWRGEVSNAVAYLSKSLRMARLEHGCLCDALKVEVPRLGWNGRRPFLLKPLSLAVGLFRTHECVLRSLHAFAHGSLGKLELQVFA